MKTAKEERGKERLVEENRVETVDPHFRKKTKHAKDFLSQKRL